jgi:hypothetical protein
MCAPVLIPVALLAASVAAQQFGQAQQTGARNKVLSRQEKNTQALLGQAEGVNRGLASQLGAEGTQAALNKQTFDRQQELQPILDNKTAQVTSLPTSGSAPTGLSRVFGDASAEGARTFKESATNAIPLEALKDVQFNQQIDIGRANQDLSRIGSFISGENSLLQPRLQSANAKGGTARTLGQVFGLAAQLYGLGGFAGGAGALAGAGSAGQGISSTMTPGFLTNLPRGSY